MDVPVDEDAASLTPIESSFAAVNGSTSNNNTSASNTTTATTTATAATPMIPSRQVPPPPPPAADVKVEGSPAPSRLNSTDAETPGAEADDDPNTNGDKKRTATAGRKRKLNNLSARGVANLTPDQLAKKRANDRQAQRAIRERTKTHIDALEQQVRDLSSQKPMLDLQAALKRNEAALEENRELRQGLKAAMDIIRPLLEKPESSSNGPAPINIERPHRPSNASPGLDNNGFTPNSQRSAMAEQSYVDSIASAGTPSPTHSAPPLGGTHRNSAGDASSFRLAFDFQRHNLAHGLDFGTEEKLGFNFLVDSSKSIPTADGSHRNSESLRTPSQLNSQPIYPPQYAPSLTELSSPAYLTPIRNTPPTCTLDAILLDFLHTRQQEAAQGVPKQNLVGPPYPSVSSLLNPEKSVDSHPLSKVFTDILRAFPNIAALPEQVCILYLMFLLMRWQIYPTAENYERLPDWLTPRPSQLLTKHPAWIDYLPWPRMRDRLVMSHQNYQFENWFVPFTETISINWPYEATDCLLSTTNSDDLLINPVFERHFRNLNNWSLGPAFAEAYPEMAETTRIRKTNDLQWQAP